MHRARVRLYVRHHILPGGARSWAVGSPLPIRRSGPGSRAFCAGCAEEHQVAVARQTETELWEEAQAARFERMTLAAQGRTSAESMRRRQAFAIAADGMEEAARRDGMWLRRYLIVKHEGVDGRWQKEGLVIASRCRGGAVEASLLVSLRGLRVLHEEAGDAVEALVAAGERHLASQTGGRRTVDWSSLEAVTSRGWFQGWRETGWYLRRPADLALPQGWRVARGGDRADGLDLLFFLFVYVHHWLERDLQWVCVQPSLF